MFGDPDVGGNKIAHDTIVSLYWNLSNRKLMDLDNITINSHLRSVIFVLVRKFAVFFAAFFVFTTSVSAQGVSGVANNIEVADAEAKPGDVVSVTADGVKRTDKPFDAQMYGVIVEFPVLSSGLKSDSTKAVMTSGQALVNVSATDGEIKPGDFVSSSTKLGIAVKASISGYVLGKALVGYNDNSKDGQIPVSVDIGFYAQNPNVSGFFGSLLGNLNVGLQNTQNFPLVMRYISASLIGIVTFIVVSFSFVRFMRHGLEAIGRNPLAKSTIITGMMVNAAIVLVMAIAGFGIAVAIIAF